MSAALKSYVPRPLPTPATPAATSRRRARAKVAKVASVAPLPISTAPSPLLVNLKRLQLVTSVMAASLVGLSLVGYGTSVYVDRQLRQSVQRLSQLQRSEQQLTTANAILTSHLAQQAENPETGLQPPKPDSVIFLRPAPQRTVAEPTPAPVYRHWFDLNRPLGY